MLTMHYRAHFAVHWILTVLPCIACTGPLLVVAFARNLRFRIASERHWHIRFIV